MENISATAPSDRLTVTWHTSPDQLFETAKDGKLPADHPFREIFDQHNEDIARGLLKQMAKDLYSTLSRTIHRF